MDALTVKEILAATDGETSFFLCKDETIRGISTDSRTVKKGDLFIALKGKYFNGHNFIPEVFQKGAKAALVSESIYRNKPIIKVKDTLKALGDIAAYYRDKFKVTAIAVTGSNGKTTTTHMLEHILNNSVHIVASCNSFNNFIGVPLTMFRIKKDTQFLIQEMETNILGGIGKLCRIVRPLIGVVTNIAPTHLEGLKTEMGVFREKSELLSSLPSQGKAVLNIDGHYFPRLKEISSAKAIITFGIKGNADFSAKEINRRSDYFCFKLSGVTVKLKTPFYKNIYNALAAAAVSSGGLGLTVKKTVVRLNSFRFLPLRGQIVKMGSAKIINDCFNANPQSMEDALLMLAASESETKIAVLGDMGELGANSEKFHYRIGKLCARLKLCALITYGAKARFITKGAREAGLAKITYCKTYSEVVKSLIGSLKSSSVVLIKGSRALRMENIVEELKFRLNK